MVHDPRWAQLGREGHSEPVGAPVRCHCHNGVQRATCEGLCLLHAPLPGHQWPSPAPPPSWPPPKPMDVLLAATEWEWGLAGTWANNNRVWVRNPGPVQYDAPRAHLYGRAWPPPDPSLSITRTYSDGLTFVYPRTFPFLGMCVPKEPA